MDELPPAKKASPDGTAIAIRTHFEDAPLHPMDQTRAWLAVTSAGMTGFLSEAAVTDWVDIPQVGG